MLRISPAQRESPQIEVDLLSEMPPLRGHHTKLDSMAVGIGDVNLECAVWPCSTWQVVYVQFLKPGFPFVHVIDQECVVISSAS